MKRLVIGVAGTTCSGKSTLASEIHKAFPRSIMINQDNYFLPVDDPRHTKVPELNCLNFDLMSSLDMKQMHADVLDKVTMDAGKLCRRESLLILEGFLLFNYKPLMELCDLKYLIDVPKDVCWERRKDRVYEPPDVPGYFEIIVWPEYLRYRAEVMGDKALMNSVKVVDGTKSKEDITRAVIAEIRQYIERSCDCE